MIVAFSGFFTYILNEDIIHSLMCFDILMEIEFQKIIHTKYQIKFNAEDC